MAKHTLIRHFFLDVCPLNDNIIINQKIICKSSFDRQKEKMFKMIIFTYIKITSIVFTECVL